MRTLVIGGNGFIGSGLVTGLVASGASVRVLDPGSPRSDVDWQGVDFMRGTLATPAMLEAALDGVDRVYHLASTTVPSTSNLDPAADVRDNLIGALQLIQAMGRAGVRRIIYFSSGGTVYGNPSVVPVPEHHPLAPVSSYGVVKVAIEAYLAMYQHLGQIDPLVLRPSNPYGPRQSSSGMQGAIGTFLRRAIDGQPITLWGDGEVVRDYLYIDDLVEFAVLAGQGGQTGIFNVGSGAGHTLNELCREISGVTGRTLDIRYEPARGFDVRRIILDPRAARERFGWQARMPLREGIERTWRAIDPSAP